MEPQPYHLVIGRDGTAIDALAFFPDAERLVTGYHDGTIGIWNMQNGKEERTPMAHGGAVIGCLVVTSEGRKLVSSDENGRTRVWDIASQKLVKEWTRPSGLSEVAISPDNRLLAIGDRKLNIYPLDGGQGIKHSIKFRGKVAEMRFSPDGDKLACVIASKLYVFDVRRGKRIFGPREDGQKAWDVLWSLDSRKLFSTWSDRAIRCFNPDTGVQIGHSWMGRATYSKFLFLSPDGSKLATRTAGTDLGPAADRIICVWDVASGTPMQIFYQRDHGIVLRTPGGLMASRKDGKIYLSQVSWSPSVGNQIGFYDYPPSPQLGRLSAQMKEGEDLHSALDVLSQPGKSGDLSSHPCSTYDQSTVMSRQCQTSKLRVECPAPLDLTLHVVKMSDRYCAGGGFGDVYRGCYDGGLVPKKVEVAIKAFRFKFPFTEGEDIADKTTQMLRRELGIWRRLSHTNVVPFLGIAYGFGMHDAMSLVSLWMPNDTLQNFLVEHDDSLGVAHRLRFLLDIADGLQYLHSLSVVHGDLNCNNVLLDADYTARLTDFGYASLVGNIPEALTYLRRSTTRPGALRWTAPEQIVLEDTMTLSRTTKSDIYTFGCVLSGKQPWSEVREDMAVVLRLSKGYKPARPEFRPVDNIHWELIEKCWSSIQERPDAEAITASIRHFLSFYPQFQPLRDIMGTSDSSSIPEPYFDQAPADGSCADIENRIPLLSGPLGSVRFRQGDFLDPGETHFGPSTAESYNNPYKKRRV